MPSFYFPLVALAPDKALTIAASPPFTLARRLWTTSTFDLATLATRHRLHLPYQLMDVLLHQCNLELQVEAPTLDTATEYSRAFMLGMFLCGVSPTLAPFATSRSVNDYSGINDRDSDLLRSKLPLDRQQGFTSKDGAIEAWPIHMSLQCMVNEAATVVSDWHFQQAAQKASTWLLIESSHAQLRVMRDAAQTAPTLPSADQALLHVWCALESLFPKVSTEVSFRLSLYLAQLAAPKDGRPAYFDRVRQAYNVRSRVAHGSESRIGHDKWLQAWAILVDAGNAIVSRGALPSEDELLAELLSPRD